MKPAKSTVLMVILSILLTVVVTIFVVRGRFADLSTSTRSNRDAVLADLIELATRAQKYYRTTTNMQGEGRSFAGLKDISLLTKYPANANGRYVILAVGDTSLTLEGTGTVKGVNDSLLFERILVTPDTLSIASDTAGRLFELATYPYYRAALAANQKYLDEAFFTNRMLVLQDLVVLGDRAQRYYRVPMQFGGGGSTFRGLRRIQLLTQYPSNQNGTYLLTESTDSTVTLEGTGIEKNAQGDLVRVRVRVGPAAIAVEPDSGDRHGTTHPEILNRSQLSWEEAVHSNGQSVLSHLNSLASRAQHYYDWPGLMGGGKKSFRNLDIRKLQEGDVVRDGIFSIVSVTDSFLVLEGRGVERMPDGSVVLIQMSVWPKRRMIISNHSAK